MNFNASGGRHPHKLGAKKVRPSMDPGPMGQVYQQPYNPYGASVPPAPGPGNIGFNQIYNPNLQNSQDPFVPMPGNSYPPPQPFNAPPAEPGFSIPNQFLTNDLVANAAMQYGEQLMGTGRKYVDKEIEKYVPISRLKYYFAVDSSYVSKKLGLILFPFTHTDWSVKYAADEPVQPRYEVNAPDLYIPTMAYLTYVLVAGLALGIQDRFTPEVLGMQASSALAWTILEILIHLITLYVTNITTQLTTIDILAFCGYKFVGIIFSVLISLVFHKTGYYISLIYFSSALSFFLIRTLKMKVLPVSTSAADPYTSGPEVYNIQVGNKRRVYFLLFMALVQPLLMWWLSYHLVPSST